MTDDSEINATDLRTPDQGANRQMMTVIMATHNGAHTLATVLEAYARLRAPGCDWKLVIADNASTDDTPSILDRFRSQLPLTTLQVPTPGKNNALNAALEHREGDLVVLTDDDAVPAKNWLHAFRRAADTQNDYDIFGGAIAPRWERPPEPWVLEWVPHDMTYTLTPTGRTDGPLMPTQVGGPNMAVRSTVFDRGHRFDPQIGPKAGGTYAMGSETEFTVRMAQNGHAAWFVADAVVEHMIRSFQMDRQWVLSRAARYGRCIYRRDRQQEHDRVALMWGMPRWLIREAVAQAFSLLLAKVTADDRRIFEASWHLRYSLGYLAEARSDKDGHAGT